MGDGLKGQAVRKGDRVVVKGSFRPCKGFRRGPTRLAKAEAAFYFDKQDRREYYIFY